MTASKKYIGSAFCFILSCFLLVCTQLDFDVDDDSDPYIEVEATLDTVLIDNDYTVVFDVFDDIDSPDDLKDAVKIWVENEDGDTVSLDSFTEEPGVYTICLQVTDSDGNTSGIVTITVLVVEDDLVPPELYLLGPVPYICNVGDKYEEPGAVAVDNFDGDISGDIEIDGEVNTSEKNESKITYSVQDKAGNKVEKERTVRVKDNNGNDTEKPKIKLKGDNPMNMFVGDSFKDPGATATDNEDGDITDKIKKFIEAINTNVPGIYKVYYTVEDRAGNVAIAKRVVKVDIDTLPPVITLLGDNPMELNLHEKYNEPGATAEDNRDGDVTDKIIINNDDVDVDKNGVYKVVYTVSDAEGNKAEEKRVVMVGEVDTVPPEIVLLGDNPMLVDYKGPYNEPGAFALDEDDHDTISFDDFTVDDNIDLNTLGEYTVTYTVSDPAGNEASAKRKVEVADTIAPVITMNGPNPVNLVEGFDYIEWGAEAVDNYDGDLTDELDTSGSVNTSDPGTYEITYKVTDSNGNTGEAIRTIHVGEQTIFTDTFSLSRRILDKNSSSGMSGGKVGGGARGSSPSPMYSYETLLYASVSSLNGKKIRRVTARFDVSHVDNNSAGRTARLYEQNKGQYSSSARYSTYSTTSGWSSLMGSMRATSNGWKDITGTSLKDLVADWTSGRKSNEGLILGGNFGGDTSTRYWLIDEAELIVEWEK